jgi:hypothetical protein
MEVLLPASSTASLSPNTDWLASGRLVAVPSPRLP